jgi:HTH-type transcriptional regulator / antitoxin HigA
MRHQLEEIAKIWTDIENVFSVPHNDKEYDRLVELLDGLIDKIGEDESHPLASLTETLGSLIEIYESRNVQEIEGNPLDSLKFLMQQHGLKQSDLKDIGSQGVVSEILADKRQLNVRQIKYLSKRFKVSPAVFM